MQKADLQPTAGKQPDHVTLEETVSHLDDQRYWLNAAVNPVTNGFLHIRLFPTRKEGVTSIFLSELTEKRAVGSAVFLIDSSSCLNAALHRHGLRFRYEKHGNRNISERLF